MRKGWLQEHFDARRKFDFSVEEQFEEDPAIQFIEYKSNDEVCWLATASQGDSDHEVDDEAIDDKVYLTAKESTRQCQESRRWGAVIEQY